MADVSISMQGTEPRPSFRVSIIAVVIFCLAALFARSTLEVSLLDRGFPTLAAHSLSYLVVPPILLILMYPYLCRCKPALLDLLRPSDLTVRVVTASILLGLTLRATRWAGLVSFISFGLVAESDTSGVAGPLIGFECPPLAVLALGFLITSFLVPIVEETVNRGFILHALLPRGKVVAILISAAIFASMHSSQSYAITVGAGVFLGVQMLNYRTLWGPLIAHATYNTSMIIDWECTQVIWNPIRTDPNLPAIGSASAAIAVVGLLVSCLLVSNKIVEARTVPRHSQGFNLKRVRDPLDDV